jgi:hypothetical protein
MFTNSNFFAQQFCPAMHQYLLPAALILVLAAMWSPVRAQTPTPTPFSSGSTEADGPFAPDRTQEIQVPESGVFNFTTVTIPRFITITFKPNSRNTPVTILATGDVKIAGYFSVGGEGGGRNFGGLGGPGGFRGGNGGVWLNDPAGKGGDGLGGGGGGAAVASGTDANGGGGGGFYTPGNSGNQGGPTPAPGGVAYGTKVLLPLIGGSGGGGASAYRTVAGGAGGGGAGAILIASSTRIVFESGWDQMGIYANGGQAGCSDSICGGAGAGGGIRLIANTITGFPRIHAVGGSGRGFRGNDGGLGFIRVEAINLQDFKIDTAGRDNYSFGRPNPVTLKDNPQLRILSVGGVNAPAQPAGSFYTAQPDLVVPETTPNPVNVVVQGTNVPGTPTIQVTRIADSGERETKTCTLANNTCSVSLSLPLSKTSLIIATTTVDGLIAFGRPVFIDGERVNQVEIGAVFGGPSNITYITESGRRLKGPQ